ncbi:MAG: hypothetical protein Q9169_004856 [Polycauliona sp. 2 TL-2023]
MPLMMDSLQQSLRQTEISPSPLLQPREFVIPLPLTLHTTLHLQITTLDTSNLIFLTSTDPSSSGSLSALGSFVYAMPNRLQPSDPLCTALYSQTGSIEFANRVAKILSRRTGKPTYVGCSIVLGNPTLEEEMAAVRAVVDKVLEGLQTEKNG